MTNTVRPLKVRYIDELSEAAQSAMAAFVARQHSEYSTPEGELLSDALLDNDDDAALLELIDLDLRAMLALYAPEHYAGVLRFLLSEIDAERITGAQVIYKDCGCVIGDMLRYACQAAAVPSSDPSRPGYEPLYVDAAALVKSGVLTGRPLDRNEVTPTRFAEWVRVQAAFKSGLGNAIGEYDLSFIEAFIYTLTPKQWFSGIYNPHSDRRKERDARRLRLLREAVSALLAELDAPACSAEAGEEAQA